ncbi:MAG: VacJ family lipoprotein [Deltaproteobacteria bacterium]|nr:MAG: VacJ family lipoprotein [Deltaproteobacteria bacterium]
MRTHLVQLAILFVLASLAAPCWAGASAGSKPPVPEAAAADEDLPFDPFDDGDDPFDDDVNAAPESVADPLSGFNRAMFVFNDRFYFWVLKPVARGYRAVIPTPARVSVKNFFFNLMMPVRFVNCLLQGKFKAADGEFGRFLVNSTIGVGGLFDPAAQFPELNPPQEDFGQTLGRYAVGNGCYLVWPLLGPSTVRDSVGAVGDWALNPLNFMTLINVDAGALTTTTTGAAVFSVRTVNDASFRLGDYETLKDAALDPYEAFRDAYIQNRTSKIAR